MIDGTSAVMLGVTLPDGAAAVEATGASIGASEFVGASASGNSGKLASAMVMLSPFEASERGELIAPAAAGTDGSGVRSGVIAPAIG